MSQNKIESVRKRKWFSGTCSDTTLFLTTRAWGSSIPFIIEWKSSVTCTPKEFIDGISYKNEMYALVIRNQSEKTGRIELRCCSTLQRIWCYVMDGIIDPDSAYHCSPLTCNEWLMIDHHTRRFLHITADEQLKTTIPCDEKPYRATFFCSNLLAVSTEKGVYFHEI